jgi:hypothetical protein
LFTAFIATWYVVPFVRPVMTSGEVADAGENAAQVVPESREY